ncbi:hypothetical protein [Consotaella salsifontis]|nr:hypothetical protein [Consotaella salsifontis]
MADLMVEAAKEDPILCGGCGSPLQLEVGFCPFCGFLCHFELPNREASKRDLGQDGLVGRLDEPEATTAEEGARSASLVGHGPPRELRMIDAGATEPPLDHGATLAVPRLDTGLPPTVSRSQTARRMAMALLVVVAAGGGYLAVRTGMAWLKSSLPTSAASPSESAAPAGAVTVRSAPVRQVPEAGRQASIEGPEAVSGKQIESGPSRSAPPAPDVVDRLILTSAWQTISLGAPAAADGKMVLAADGPFRMRLGNSLYIVDDKGPLSLDADMAGKIQARAAGGSVNLEVIRTNISQAGSR